MSVALACLPHSEPTTSATEQQSMKSHDEACDTIQVQLITIHTPQVTVGPIGQAASLPVPAMP